MICHRRFWSPGSFWRMEKAVAWHLCFIHQFPTVCFSGVTLQNSLSIDCPGDSWKGDWKVMSMVDFQTGKRSYLYFQINVKARRLFQNSKFYRVICIHSLSSTDFRSAAFMYRNIILCLLLMIWLVNMNRITYLTLELWPVEYWPQKLLKEWSIIRVLTDSCVSGLPVLSWQEHSYFPRAKMSLAAMPSAFSASPNHKLVLVSKDQVVGPNSVITDNYSLHCN